MVSLSLVSFAFQKFTFCEFSASILRVAHFASFQQALAHCSLAYTIIPKDVFQRSIFVLLSSWKFPISRHVKYRQQSQKYRKQPQKEQHNKSLEIRKTALCLSNVRLLYIFLNVFIPTRGNHARMLHLLDE